MAAPSKLLAAPYPRRRRVDLVILLSHFRSLTSDALPLTTALHPSVGEIVGAIESFTVFASAFLARTAGYDRDAWSERCHLQALVLGRRVSVFVLLELGKEARPVGHFEFGRYTDEISCDK